MSFTNYEKTIMQQAIEKYGWENQIGQYHEESAELTVALNKARRGKYQPQFIPDIAEEIADVYIMLYQLQRIFNIEQATINSEIGRKLTRLEQRMKNKDDTDFYKL
jgi:NTP pyrophosphatase (non-canonical NTP hydrolase)